MAWSTADIPDQSGRIAVVTGANGGLGLETSRALAAAGAHVVMAARNQEKAAAAVEDIRSTVAEPALEVVALDLGSQDSARAAAEQILATHDRIDLLINNAGVMGIPERKTVDGYEMQFGVDHLGHWSLTALLMPALLRGGAARIVTVTSTAHHMGRAVDPANPHLEGRYGPWRAYGQAKLANFHFGLGLQRQLEAAGAPAASLIAHPGLSNTDLQAVSVQETGGGRSQRFFHRMAGSTGCLRRRERCRSCAPPPTRGQAAASSTARSGSTTGRRCASPSSGGSEWTRRSASSGRCRSARPGSRSRSLRRSRPAAEPLTVSGVDRAAAVRQAVRTLVAEHGFHGASMSAVAAEAGVATGTAYTHYASKDELLLAAYRETKAELAAAATSDLDSSAGPAKRFELLWLSAYRHLAANREHALFLLQVDCSPYRDEAHDAALAVGDDPLLREAASADIAARLLPLPLEVLYELGLAPGGAARRERHRAQR